jgi:hypothetical protein
MARFQVGAGCVRRGNRTPSIALANPRQLALPMWSIHDEAEVPIHKLLIGGNGCYLRKRDMAQSGWSRRIADVTDRGLERLNWAESGPYAATTGKPGVRRKADAAGRRKSLRSALLRRRGHGSRPWGPAASLDRLAAEGCRTGRRMMSRDERPELLFVVRA